MEEILASIRRIISEDDAPAEAAEPAAAAAPAPAEEPVAFHEPPEEPPAPAPIAAEPEEEDDDGVLELTERVEVAAEEPEETVGDIEVYAAPEPVHAPEPSRAEVAWRAPPADEEPLVGRSASQTAASAFGQLAQTLAMPRDGRTLEDVVRELLKPLLKQWLDEHLPEIVQAKVESEVERIARGPRR